MDKNMKMLHMVAFLLVIIGGINWLVVGLFDLNLVSLVFGESLVAKLVYILVGLSAVYIMVTHKKDCKICSS
jgi:uncharacterized membrane protein YuzA (DUF378 family)